MNTDKLKKMIGLAAKAGKAVYGTPLICESLRMTGDKKCFLVLEGSDSSENTHKKIMDKCRFYQIRHVRLQCDGASLAAALGKTSCLAAVAVNDASMVKLVESCLTDQPTSTQHP